MLESICTIVGIRMNLILLTLFSCRTDDSLKTVNAEPTALIVSHADGDEPMANEEAVLFGSVSDTNHPPEDLLTVWRVDFFSSLEKDRSKCR